MYESNPPTRCFECGDRFEETVWRDGSPVCGPKSSFSEDEHGNRICKDCTIKAYGSPEDFRDHLEERAYGLAGLAEQVQAEKPLKPARSDKGRKRPRRRA